MENQDPLTMPEVVGAFIDAVVKKMGYRRKVRAEVRS